MGSKDHIRFVGRGKTKIAMAIALFALLLASVAISVGAGKVSAQSAAPHFTLNSVVATTTGLNLRDQPSASGKTVAVLPLNAQAIVAGGPFNDGWYWLNYKGTKGYANGVYLVVVDASYKPIPTATATSVSTSTPVATSTATATPPTSTRVAAATTATVATKPRSTAVAATPAAAVTPDYTAPTAPGDYTGLWLGELIYGGNVRTGPGLDQPVLKSWGVGRRVLLYQAVTDSKGGVWYRVSEPPEGPMYVHSSLIRKIEPVKFQGARYKGKWVEVNLAQQITTAYVDGTPVKVTLASTGTAANPTTPGVWKIYWRLLSQEMKNGNLGSPDYYDLKNVPYVQYFQMSGEALHGTYWHDDFGRPRSHGCVNLSIPMAGWFYGWAGIGTIVYVH